MDAVVKVVELEYMNPKVAIKEKQKVWLKEQNESREDQLQLFAESYNGKPGKIIGKPAKVQFLEQE